MTARVITRSVSYTTQLNPPATRQHNSIAASGHRVILLLTRSMIAMSLSLSSPPNASASTVSNVDICVKHVIRRNGTWRNVAVMTATRERPASLPGRLLSAHNQNKHHIRRPPIPTVAPMKAAREPAVSGRALSGRRMNVRGPWVTSWSCRGSGDNFYLGLAV